MGQSGISRILTGEVSKFIIGKCGECGNFSIGFQCFAIPNERFTKEDSSGLREYILRFLYLPTYAYK